MARRPNDEFFDGEVDDAFAAGDDGAPDAEEYGPEPREIPNAELTQAGAPRSVEAFVPTDFYPATAVRGPHRRHRSRRKRRVAWAVLLCLGIILLCVGGAYAYTLLTDPASAFENVPTPKQPGKTPGADGAVDGEPDASPTPTIDPYQVVYEQADTSMMQGIVNVLVIGVDYAEERETWSGKHEYHSDVMLVLAINFHENRVDLISLPRDTYAKIPGVKGIYKLNAAINCGGGFDAPDGAGFLKTCEAASWMLGGIPVNYYYAVTMPAVKQLADAVGGVNYDLDFSFSLAGRRYTAGMQHLDGQGVLDYLRVRKNVQESGDANRVNRQKQMLVALFSQMQDQNLILKIPDIIRSFSGQLYTNCSAGQTAALAAFAYRLPRENIGMYSMGGRTTNIFEWNFCLTDQSNRVKIIETVYGIEAPRYRDYTADYAHYRWADMLAEQYLKTVRGLTDYVAGRIAADDLLPTASPVPTEEPTPPPEEPTPEGVFDTLEPIEGAAYRADDQIAIARLSLRGATRGEAVQQYGAYQRDLFNRYLNALEELEAAQVTAKKEASRYLDGKSNKMESATKNLTDWSETLKSYALSLAQEFGYSTGKFTWVYRYYNDRKFNEIAVDFR